MKMRKRSAAALLCIPVLVATAAAAIGGYLALLRDNSGACGTENAHSCSQPASSAYSPAVLREVAWFKDSDQPLSDRRARIAALAGNGDAHSIRVLMALGDQKTYLNCVAVEALGDVGSNPAALEAGHYLAGKLRNSDLKVATAAIRAYGQLRGEAAVPAVLNAIHRNRYRRDGYGGIVAVAAVQALGRIGSRNSVPGLSAELGRSGRPGWNLDYGSEVVSALARIDTPGARAAVSAYADRLAAVPRKLPPQAQRHVETKIAEARRVAESR
jgi:hypothetical protein